jgi:periplasmic divalent cation tolerance protein
MTADTTVLVLTTLPVEADAQGFSRVLVEERLAACVSVYAEMTSTYRWQGAIETARERQVVIKSTWARLSELRERVRSLHPYDVPEWLVLPAAAVADPYLGWVRESTTR